MSEGQKDAIWQTGLSIIVGFIVGIIHGGALGYLAFISLQITAILSHVSKTD
jgi:hypothetical protein